MRLYDRLMTPVVFPPEARYTDERYNEELKDQYDNDPEVGEILSQWVVGQASDEALVERLKYLRELAEARAQRVLEEDDVA